MYSFYSTTVFTFLLLLITFEPLKLKQSYIPHGINALGVQWCGCIFMFCYIDLNLALLLHKTVLVTFLLASAVDMKQPIDVKNNTFDKKANLLYLLLILT